MDLAVHAKQYKHYTIEAKNVKKKDKQTKKRMDNVRCISAIK